MDVSVYYWRGIEKKKKRGTGTLEKMPARRNICETTFHTP